MLSTLQNLETSGRWAFGCACWRLSWLLNYGRKTHQLWAAPFSAWVLDVWSRGSEQQCGFISCSLPLYCQCNVTSFSSSYDSVQTPLWTEGNLSLQLVLSECFITTVGKGTDKFLNTTINAIILCLTNQCWTCIISSQVFIVYLWGNWMSILYCWFM